MCNKLTIAVVFGGQSSEHDVSCISALTIIKALRPEKYEMILIGITKEGRWLLTDSIQDVESGAWRDSRTQAIISPDAGALSFLKTERCGRKKLMLFSLYSMACTVKTERFRAYLNCVRFRT